MITKFDKFITEKVNIETEMKDFDWSKVFEPLSEEEKALYAKQAEEDEKKELTEKKDALAKELGYNKSWNEIVLALVKSIKGQMKLMRLYYRKGKYDSALANHNYVLEEIADLKKLKYAAKEYAENLEKIFKKEVNDLFKVKK